MSLFNDLIDGVVADNKEFGLVKADAVPEYFEAIPTGIAGIDNVLHGGIPRGRITEVFGPESCGKTTLLLHCARSALQEDNAIVVFIDTENALDTHYCKNIGLDLSRVAISQPDCGEQVFAIILSLCERQIKMAEKGSVARLFIAVDSLASMVPWDALKDPDLQKPGIALQARMLSRLLPRLLAPVKRSGAAVIFTNQVRDNIGGYGGAVTPGGRAMKFYASCRYKLSSRGKWMQGDSVLGVKTVLQVVKSKLYPPLQGDVEFFIGGNGIDDDMTTINAADNAGLIKSGGAWMTLQLPDMDPIKAQGAIRLLEKVKGTDGALDALKKYLFH